MNLYKSITSDFNKYRKYGGNFISIFFFTQGFWAIFQYRIANLAYRKVHIPIIRQLVIFVLLIWQKCIEITTGISIPYSCTIGHSFYIGHFGGIIINANAKIGDNCNISQGVTIGVSGRGDNRGVPVLGDNIYIGANAVLAGKIKIGSNCVIAANSLVIESIIDNSTVIGVPAKVINQLGSKGYI